MVNFLYQFFSPEYRSTKIFKNKFYTNGEKSGRTKLCKVIDSDNKYKIEWYLNEKNISLLEFNMDYQINGNGFDILLYAIKKGISAKVIKFIIKRAPYLDLNYGCIESNNSFSVPLFTAISNNDFDVADLLIERGADTNFIFKHIIGDVNEDDISYIRKDFKYCENLEYNDTTFIYNRVILADAVKYLCEVNRLNQKNLNYLIKKNYDITNINTELFEKLKKNNKENYITILSDMLIKNIRLIEE